MIHLLHMLFHGYVRLPKVFSLLVSTLDHIVVEVQCGPPLPSYTIVISIKNNSYWSYVHQLSFVENGNVIFDALARPDFVPQIHLF